MSNFLERIENVDSLFDVQRKKYRECLFLMDTVPASTTRLAKVAVGNVGDFRSYFITASYTTLVLTDDGIFDSGFCSLSAKITDGNNQTLLFNDFIPFELWASPGRIKSILSGQYLADAPGAYFMMPLEFEYLFARNVDILVEVKNTANTPNTWKICFHGFRYRQ